MLYLFYGTDRNMALKKALDIIEKKTAEKKDAVVFKVDSENITPDLMMELCGGQGLFEQKFIVHVKDVMSDENSKTIVFKFLSEIAESENIFIWTDGAILKKDFTKIEKSAEKVWEYIKKDKAEVKENIFKITDYVLARDKKNLWIEYQNLRKTFVPEEIHGTLFWCFKNIVLVSKSKDSNESGLKPFVYSNSKKALNKYSDEEIQNSFWKLTKILGDSRRGEGELDVLLEKWILEI